METRTFATGATRDQDTTKLDYEGFVSPLVWMRYALYMHECRLRNIPEGKSIRESDNWQKGIPRDAYMKSHLRHTMDLWMWHRNWKHQTDKEVEDTLCAILFNTQGYLHELLKSRLEEKVDASRSR